MDNYEILTRFRWLMEEAWTLSQQAEKVLKIGRPAGIAIQAITGMPHGTNDKDAAAIQLFDGYAAKLREKVAEIMSICDRFEKVMTMLENDRDRDICRKYYALGMTDDQIAKRVHMDQSTVCRIRNEAIAKIIRIENH